MADSTERTLKAPPDAMARKCPYAREGTNDWWSCQLVTDIFGSKCGFRWQSCERCGGDPASEEVEKRIRTLLAVRVEYLDCDRYGPKHVSPNIISVSQAMSFYVERYGRDAAEDLIKRTFLKQAQLSEAEGGWSLEKASARLAALAVEHDLEEALADVAQQREAVVSGRTRPQRDEASPTHAGGARRSPA